MICTYGFVGDVMLCHNGTYADATALQIVPVLDYLCDEIVEV